MPRHPASAPLRIALPLALCALSRLAAAQDAAFETGAVAAGMAPAEAVESAPPWRPRLSLAAGMGATFDATGFAGGTHTIPAFFAVGGFGDGLMGFDLGSFASSASGRFHSSADNPVDRLALDAFGVVRPAARLARGDRRCRYCWRVLRTAAAEVGLGFERDGRVTGSGNRFALHTGARVELPLTRSGQASELRLRLAVRRDVGLFTPKLYGATASDVTLVGDSTEIYAALAVIF
ncbi:MAG TPA: hypothetical protein VFG23_00555 [Polyangia bacterium]|nr:hypothetical protein [Polyangia bacterium]